MKAKITALPKAEEKLKELTIPTVMPGEFVEGVLKEEGYVLQDGQGPDIPGLGVEVKSRCNTATSPNTVGKMSVADIINTPYRESPIFKKIQLQFRVVYDKYTREVLNPKIVDFTDKHIQEIIEDAYETGRQQFKEGLRGPYIKGTQWGHWELDKQTQNSYSFRIPDKRMKDLVSMSTSSFNDLFE